MSEDFFDMRERLTTRPKAPAAPANTDVLSVTQLTAQIDRALKAGLRDTLLVRGELSNVSMHRASGHLYFTLKDNKCCVDCVMFAREAASLAFKPQDGTEVLLTGRVGVYGARGRYQLYATRLEPIGQGALELKFRQLQQKLEAEGLFASERKKPLPQYPMRVALVTGRETAALQDMLKVLSAFPWIRLLLLAVPVQGVTAGGKIASAVDQLSRQARPLRIDLIILARGGGSLEDLWAFNEEVVARAIARSRVPIVTGIGHEVDVSIADLVADYHAHTPTEAARVAGQHWKQIPDVLSQSSSRLTRAVRQGIGDALQQLLAIRRHEMFRRPTDRIDTLRQLLDDRQRQFSATHAEHLRRERNRLTLLATRLQSKHPRHGVVILGQQLAGLKTRLARAGQTTITRSSDRLQSLDRHLQAVGPTNVLNRGYSITSRKTDGAIIRSVTEIAPGDRLVTRFKDGQRESVVRNESEPGLFD